MSNVSRPTPPGPQVRAGNLTTATTGLIIWGMENALFHNALPGAVYAFIVLAVPALCGRLGAELAYRRALRRLDCPQAP